MKKMLSLALGLSLAVTLMAAPLLAEEVVKASGESVETESKPEEKMEEARSVETTEPESEEGTDFARDCEAGEVTNTALDPSRQVKTKALEESDISEPLLNVLAAVLVKREGMEDETSEEYLQKVADKKKELEGLREEELDQVLEGLSGEELDTVLSVLLEDRGEETARAGDKDFWNAVGEALEGIDEKDMEEYLSQIDLEEVKAFLGDLGGELGGTLNKVTEEDVEEFLESFSEEDYTSFWNGLFEAFGGKQS